MGPFHTIGVGKMGGYGPPEFTTTFL